MNQETKKMSEWVGELLQALRVIIVRANAYSSVKTGIMKSLTKRHVNMVCEDT